MTDLIREFYSVGEVWRVEVREGFLEDSPLERSGWGVGVSIPYSYRWGGIPGRGRACVGTSMAGTACANEASEVSTRHPGLSSFLGPVRDCGPGAVSSRVGVGVAACSPLYSAGFLWLHC